MRMSSAYGMAAGLTLLAVAAIAGVASGEDWTQWRGPRFNGSSEQTGLPTSWGSGQNIAWATPMPGPGNSTPVILGKRIFLTSAQADGLDLYALCLDLETGKKLWQVKLGTGNKKILNYNVSSPSAVADEQAVYVLFGTGDLAALDHAGKVLWRRNIEEAYGPVAIKWGYSASPLLYKGKLFLPLLRNTVPYAYTDQPQKYKNLPSLLVAIDPASGKELLRASRETEADDEHRETYATPLPYEAGGRSEVVLIGGDYLTGHDPADGKELWRWMYNPKKVGTWRRIVSTPTLCQDLVIGSLPRHTGMFAVRPGRGAMPLESAAWTFDGSTPDACSPLYYGGRLYVLNGVKKDLACLDPKTGKAIWQTPLKTRSVLRASPTGADGKVYLISESGETIVLAAGDEYRELARFEMGEKPVRSTIVPADGGRLLIRTAKHIYCARAK